MGVKVVGWTKHLRNRVLQVRIFTHKSLHILDYSLESLKKTLSGIDRYLALRYSAFYQRWFPS